jgi:hypothetical protein
MTQTPARGRAAAPQHLAPQPGAAKRSEIRFAKSPPDQAERAAALLAGLEFLEVRRGPHPRGIRASYDLVDYTLEGLETALRKLGYRLDDSLPRRIVRALTYFTEATQLSNLKEPVRLIKQSNQVYIKAYEHHPHGDHDDTPAELREDR